MKCDFCEANMMLAWSGETPTGYPLEAYICTKCFATHYIGQVNDPVFQMLKEIYRGFMVVWKKRLQR